MSKRQFPEIPATVSTRDARYISPYLEIVTEQLESAYSPGTKFSIIDATEKLKCLTPLKQTTRVDVAGAIIRTLLAMNILSREGKRFVFPAGKRVKKPVAKPSEKIDAKDEKPKKKTIRNKFAPAAARRVRSR